MLDIDIDADTNLVTLKPTGALSEDDFAQLKETVDGYINEKDAVPNLLITPEGIPHWSSLQAMLAHAQFVRGHHKLVRKVAVVSDNVALSMLPSVADHFVSAKVRHFATDKVDQARKWATEEDDHPDAFEPIDGLPSDVIAFKVKGTVTSQDYETMLTPLVEERLKQHDKLKVLCVMDDDFGSFTAGAMWDDARLGFMHYSDFAKLALVTDIGWVRTATKFFAPLIPSEVHVFDLDQLDNAKAWVS